MGMINVACCKRTPAGPIRRPHRYGLLTSLEVEKPFVRVDASGEAYDRVNR